MVDRTLCLARVRPDRSRRIQGAARNVLARGGGERRRGVARFSPAEIVFEDVAGELAKGRFEGRLAFKNGSDGLSARVNVDLRNAEAGAIFAGADRPALIGRLAFQSELEGVGRSPAAFIGSLAGYGTMTLEQARLGGLNPGVFDAVTRAVELGIPTDGNRIRDFVSGVLDSADLTVSQATASVSVNAGQARFRDIVIRAAGAQLEATASVDLAAATLDTLLTLTGLPVGTGRGAPGCAGRAQGAVADTHAHDRHQPADKLADVACG